MINRRMTKNLVASILMGVILLMGCNTQSVTSGDFAQIPAGLAYAEGKVIYFTHTETSDAAIAEKLTKMMDSPVLLVPSLALVPKEVLANVYVFENGVKGKGPLGFQPDVFDNPPGTEGYTPLREIILVKWNETASVVEYKSSTEIEQAAEDGTLSLTPSNVVVNMPFIVWDGGKR